MASQEHDSSAPGSLPDAPPPAPDHHGNKSFKRKYAKQKVHFENVMRESNALYKEEMRIQKLSRRLKEQNDQLLELLLEFNSSVRVPPPLRYDIQLPGEQPREQDDIPAVPYGPATAKEQLEDAKARLLAGEISAETCHRLEASILKGEAFAPSTQYSSLLKVPHSELDTTSLHQSIDDEIDTTLGFLTPAHDAEFSASLEAPTTAQQHITGEKQSPTERDRELAFRNPVSVYNWLRKNQPQVFLQDKDTDAASEKGVAAAASRSTNTRAAKRQSAAQARREEHDAYDEDGIALEPVNTTGTGRGKRKRDEDGGYRPKGGSGGRAKKKKEDGAKRSKRSSAAGSAE